MGERQTPGLCTQRRRVRTEGESVQPQAKDSGLGRNQPCDTLPADRQLQNVRKCIYCVTPPGCVGLSGQPCRLPQTPGPSHTPQCPCPAILALQDRGCACLPLPITSTCTADFQVNHPTEGVPPTPCSDPVEEDSLLSKSHIHSTGPRSMEKTWRVLREQTSVGGCPAMTGARRRAEHGKSCSSDLTSPQVPGTDIHFPGVS